MIANINRNTINYMFFAGIIEIVAIYILIEIFSYNL